MMASLRFSPGTNTAVDLQNPLTLYLECLSTTIGHYRVFWWQLSAGWVRSQGFAIGSPTTGCIVFRPRSDLTFEMGIGLGGHGRGWVRPASAGKICPRVEAKKWTTSFCGDIFVTRTFLRSCISVDKAWLKQSIIMSGNFLVPTWLRGSRDELLDNNSAFNCKNF